MAAVELIAGLEFSGDGGDIVWALAQEGRVRALQPPEGDVLDELNSSGSGAQEVPALG